MPAVPTIIHGDAARRTSFYGRSRATSSNGPSSSVSSSSSSSSSAVSSRQHDNTSNSSTTTVPSSSSSSSSATSTKTASSVQRSLSPSGKKQIVVAVAAAANAASKKLTASKASSSSSATSEQLRSEANTVITFDEQAYHGEIVKHMHRMEEETTACLDLMDAQPELRWYMRPYLVDFVVEIHQTFRLRPETLFLTMNIVDRYVSKRIVYKRHYQLVGCAALLIAAKFEDAKDKVPLVSELAQMCCSAYDESAFVQMEGHVLSTVGWTLGFPTPEAWLRLACATASPATLADGSMDGKTLNVTRFLLETTLFTRDFVGVLPSHLTEGCLLLARIIAACAGDNSAAATAAAVVAASPHAIDVAQRVDARLIEHAHALSEILIKKYSFSHCHQASTVVVAWYAALAEQHDAASANGRPLPSTLASLLLPAPRFTTPAADVAADAMSSVSTAASLPQSSSSSSFSTPRRSAEDMQDDEEDDDDDDNVSMHSRSTASSSMISTPSQMSTDDEEDQASTADKQNHCIRRRVRRQRHHHADEDDEDDDDDDEESDMPVTPLSLNSLHDPLVATEAKENGASHGVPTMVKTAATSVAAGAVSEQQQQYLQPRDERRALALSQQDNRLAVA